MTQNTKALLIDEGEYVTAEVAARLLGVKPATLYSYASRGRVPSWRQGIKRRRLYRLEDIEALLRLEPAVTATARIPAAEDWVPYTG